MEVHLYDFIATGQLVAVDVGDVPHGTDRLARACHFLGPAVGINHLTTDVGHELSPVGIECHVCDPCAK